jgi:hypothetical protein
MRFFAILLVLVALAWAAPLKHIAVFETMADADSVMNEPELRYLTNELRKQATNELPTASYSVMTRDNIFSLLPPDKNAAECFEGQCLVEIGRNVGADYAVQGTVSKFGSLLTLTVECYETMSGKLLKSFTAESPNVEGLLGETRKQARPLFDAILASDGNTRTASATPSVGESIEPKIVNSKASGSIGWNHWVGIGLDVLGAAGLAFGVYQNSQVIANYDDYKAAPTSGGWQKVEDAKTLRNVGYVAGGVLLAGGLTLHFAF